MTTPINVRDIKSIEARNDKHAVELRVHFGRERSIEFHTGFGNDMRPEDARMVAAALNEAADQAENHE